jgi:hypothetical protein
MTTHDPATVGALEAKLPKLSQKCKDYCELRMAFASEADVIEDKALVADYELVRGRIDCMLKNLGLIPGEEEGEPCS